MTPSTQDSPESSGGDWPSDWLRATLGLFALRALEAGPSYGYAIIGEFERHGLGTVKGGTLYPLLTRYEAAGLVATEWRPGDAGPGRKYFALTEHGLDELQRLRTEWARFAEVSNSYLGTTQPGKEINP
ncbi:MULTISPECIES: PadR family transcriptional regulator [Cryobacterium]|uniref:PadR family transcriptional regulator n=1 Tax=Cryobacterium breve TaxID=1259258 RepID=A0ABY2IXJ1_9MICO|nr:MULTISPECIES: PadR family transcriptional regulator [Cryobacterium]TFC97076.1 PadR family transcriptional regulator [Cryobacterium sp. TmT3-12]TFC97128.1 PadR family transcriptional regulator [Cryobacterium breve]